MPQPRRVGNYAVPVRVRGLGAEAEFYLFVAGQQSDLMAAEVARGQLALVCRSVTPKLLVDEFEVGRPVEIDPRGV